MKKKRMIMIVAMVLVRWYGGKTFLQWNLERHRFRYRQTGSKREITSIAWKKMKL